MRLAIRRCLCFGHDGAGAHDGPCRQPTSGTRCEPCARVHAAPRRAVYDDPRWRRLRALVIREWVRIHGWWCPGYRRPGHDVAPGELTADHIIPIALGGAPFERRNIAVLCRGCNARKRDT